jgi:hypothetical protein
VLYTGSKLGGQLMTTNDRPTSSTGIPKPKKYWERER